MNVHLRTGSRQAFSLLELLATIGIIALIAALLLPALQDARKKALRTRCSSNLRQIGIALNIWAHEHDSKLPMAVSTNSRGTAEYAVPGESMVAFRHFQALSNELQETRLLICPADRRVVAPFSILENSNISYAINVRAVAGNPDSVLVADRNLRTSGRVEPAFIQFGPGDKVEWSSTLHGHRGNVLFGDGHVDVIATPKATTALTVAGEVTLAMPAPDASFVALASPPATLDRTTQLPPSIDPFDAGAITNTSTNAVATNATATASSGGTGVGYVDNYGGETASRPSGSAATGVSAGGVNDTKLVPRSRERDARLGGVAAGELAPVALPVNAQPNEQPAAVRERTATNQVTGEPSEGEDAIDSTLGFAKSISSTATRHTYLLLALIVAIAVFLEIQRRRRNRKKARAALDRVESIDV